ncbi:hypothetical protein [Qipengyuania marisflavi]|uniref:DUF3106 domain-containing protein n=1 Tax=Qipengyuania marisflavi TaxID=2486356 RepID=A0A5S3P9L5_9SPHN|nr:hypothetical protein [Qipengyuania marisflavi]TMM50151.1 hypothetical protein FEV51_02890 [Qipengyuania marisflavi]
MRNTFWYIIGGQLATISIPAMAQEPPPTEAEAPLADETVPAMMTAEQSAIYAGWTAEKRAEHDGWADDIRAYFWTLPAARQDIFWRLTHNDKSALTAMVDADRVAIWDMLEKRIESQSAVTPPASEPTVVEPMAEPEPEPAPEPMR